MKAAIFIGLSLIYAVAAFFLIQVYALQCGLAFPDERCVTQVEAHWPYVLVALILLYGACGIWYWRRR